MAQNRQPGSFLDRLIERLDRLDPASVQTYVLRLLREKGFMETVFNTIKEGVIVIDRQLKIHYFNAAARNLLGLQDDFTGHRIDRYLREVQWHRIMTADAAEWQRISLQEIEVFYPVHRYLSFYLVPLQGGDTASPIPLIVLILHDVTGQYQDAQKTIESQKVQAITMLAAGVAHEIGNPLNSLTIHLQLLQRRLNQCVAPADAQEANELLEVASQEVTRLDSIINNFLRAIRPVEPHLERLQVQAVLTEVLGFMHQEIEDRNVLVETSLPENMPLVMGDSGQLKQAFYNIVKNAIQAMPEGGLLRIGGETRENFLEIRFADTGKGIPSEHFPRIMEPYFTTRPDGTGLGLMIVDRIIRSHGGELGIDSIPGSGTVFTIRLPLHERQLRLLRAAPPIPAGGEAENP